VQAIDANSSAQEREQHGIKVKATWRENENNKA
jgi:hypothetical protein